jgi:hypothetical protein
MVVIAHVTAEAHDCARAWIGNEHFHVADVHWFSYDISTTDHGHMDHYRRTSQMARNGGQYA